MTGVEQGFPLLGTIAVEVPRRCHRPCTSCCVSLVGERTPELSPTEIADAVGAIVAATGCSRVQLSGGEPLLRSDILESIDRLHGVGAAVSIITDGSDLDERLANALVERRYALAGSYAKRQEK